MGFESILRDSFKDLKGVQGVSLVGLDGISISTVVMEGEPDLDSMAAELTTFLKTLRTTTSSLNGENVDQMVIYTPASATVLYEVTREYFILAMVKRPALFGKIRYRLLGVCERLKEEMA